MIGGGPAGLAAAIVCATHGLRTALFERQRYPIDKPCGEGLLPNGVEALARIGLSTELPVARPIVGIRYHTSRGRTAEAQFSRGSGLGIRRRDLSYALLAKARTLDALEVVTGQAAGVTQHPSGRPLVRTSGLTLRPKLVIGADGLHSRTRVSAGIAFERGRRQRWGCAQHFSASAWTDCVEVYFERGFEAYVTPVPGGVNVAVLWDAQVVRPPAGSSPVAALAGRNPFVGEPSRGSCRDRPCPSGRPIRRSGPATVVFRRPAHRRRRRVRRCSDWRGRWRRVRASGLVVTHRDSCPGYDSNGRGYFVGCASTVRLACAPSVALEPTSVAPPGLGHAASNGG